MLGLRLVRRAHPLAHLGLLLLACAAAVTGLVLLDGLARAVAAPQGRAGGALPYLLWGALPLCAGAQLATAIACAVPGVRAREGLAAAGVGHAGLARPLAAVTACAALVGSTAAGLATVWTGMTWAGTPWGGTGEAGTESGTAHVGWSRAVYSDVAWSGAPWPAPSDPSSHSMLSADTPAHSAMRQLDVGWAQLPLAAALTLLCVPPLVMAGAAWAGATWTGARRRSAKGQRGEGRPPGGSVQERRTHDRATRSHAAHAHAKHTHAAHACPAHTRPAHAHSSRGRPSVQDRHPAQSLPDMSPADSVTTTPLRGALLAATGLTALALCGAGQLASYGRLLTTATLITGWITLALGLVIAVPGVLHLCGRALATGHPGALRLLSGRALQQEAAHLGRPLGMLCAVYAGTVAALHLSGTAALHGAVVLHGTDTGNATAHGSAVDAVHNAAAASTAFPDSPAAALGLLLVPLCATAAAIASAATARVERAPVAGVLQRMGAPRSLLRRAAALRTTVTLSVLSPLAWLTGTLAALPLMN